MVDATGRVKVMTSGSPRRPPPRDRGGSSGYLLGSPEYMSRSRRGNARPTERSDLYSLGIVIHEIFTGPSPSGAAPPSPPCSCISRPKRASTILLSLPPQALLARCLAKAPEERFGSAQELSAAIEAAGGRHAAGPRGARARRRRVATLATLAVLLVGRVSPPCSRARPPLQVNPSRREHGDGEPEPLLHCPRRHSPRAVPDHDGPAALTRTSAAQPGRACLSGPAGTTPLACRAAGRAPAIALPAPTRHFTGYPSTSAPVVPALPSPEPRDPARPRDPLGRRDHRQRARRADTVRRDHSPDRSAR